MRQKPSPHDDGVAALRRYYDALSRRLLRRRRIGAGEGAEHLTMHRALVDPDAPDAAPSQLVLEKLIDGAIDWPDAGVAFSGVDLGCGYGGVSLRFAERRGGHWLGLTLSPVQAARAQAAARERGLDDRAQYVARSYDAAFEPDRRFDIAVAVESLIHSRDKTATLSTVAAAMRPGAQIVIVDDVAVTDPPAVPSTLAEARAQFEAGWMAPAPLDEGGWRAALAAAGFETRSAQDLTPLTRPRPDATLSALVASAAGRRRRAIGRSRRAVIDGEIGGFALERLYNAGAMRYLMFAARRR